jgi:hypothetical protein
MKPKQNKNSDNTKTSVLSVIRSIASKGFTDTVHTIGVDALLNAVKIPQNVDEGHELVTLFTVSVSRNMLSLNVKPAVGILLRSDKDVVAFLKLANTSRNFIAFFAPPVTRPLIMVGKVSLKRLMNARLSVFTEVNPRLPIVFERVKDGERVVYNMVQYVSESESDIEEVTVATLQL